MFSVRRATIRDIERIHLLASRVFPDTYREVLSPEQLDFMLDWMYSPANLRKQMDEGHVYLLLSKNGEDCGYASVERQGPNLFHLQKIYVLPEFQGQQAGRFLFEEVVKHLRTEHPASPCVMELNVNRQNPAVRFYQRMGMRIDRQGDFPIGRGFYMNDYIMKMELGESGREA
ncbi:MAG: GNAT family N-acetyltransferase, partial [Acidobacteriota bacterium]|nr:GNAT family N-acetyltransferase [Acidobacteriota bacterium]